MTKTEIPITRGKRVILEIKGMNHAGEGVGRFDGFTVFVPWSVPGDRVEVEVISVQKNYARGLVCSLITPSIHRQEAPCPYHGECGGCRLQHLQYREQLAHKQEVVENALKRLGGIDVPINPVVGMKEPWYYRNKGQYPLGEDNGQLKIGFYKQRSHELIDISHCLIQHPSGDRVVHLARKLIAELEIPIYNEKDHTGLLRHLVTRTSFKSGEVLLVLVTNGHRLPSGDPLVTHLTNQVKDLVGIVQNVNTRRTNVILGEENLLLWGRDYVREEVGGLKFHISAGSFFQVNPLQAKLLFDLVCDFADLKGKETVFDLYCGNGAISLFLSSEAARVIGIESYAPAVADGRKNVQLNGISNVEFHTGRAEELMPGLMEKSLWADVIVVDPPRKGCDKKLLAAMVKMQPLRIIYVSCNPSTLARDLHYLDGSGYKLKHVQPIDMFPHTAHVECVVLMSREEK